MGFQKALWLACIVASVSAAVSVATVCVVLPQVAPRPTVTETVPAPTSDIHDTTMLQVAADDPRAVEIAAEHDRAAIDAIRQRLDINVLAGTVFENTADSKDTSAPLPAEQIATRALTKVAEQLRADGHDHAAELVQAAAAHLQIDAVRAASAEQPTKSR